ETLSALEGWARDPNYHVRRLVSEGTRPKLPWAKAVSLAPDQTLPLLDLLHADPTRYVTRSVANHMNDLTKTVPDLALARLSRWREAGLQEPDENAWMTRHALRTLIKSGHAEALEILGYRSDVPVSARLTLEKDKVALGDILRFHCTVYSDVAVPILVDYRIVFARPDGRTAQKVFKLKQGHAGPDSALTVRKAHKIKADATTFTWHPGAHQLILQVNGVDRATQNFELC
ncbi:MAG: hypothetical protein PVI41_12465, partial [Roseobacter sp.]